MPTTCPPHNQIALITGAARRIGAAIARQLHAEGYRIALHYHGSADEAFALANLLNAKRGGSVAIFCADLRSADQIKTLLDEVGEWLGAPAVLVNNASSYFPTALDNLDADAVDELLATNIRAPLLLTSAAAQAGALRSVVNLLDVHSRHQPRAGFVAYTAAKAALWSATEALAIEMAPKVRVNGVALGHIDASVQPRPTPAEQLDLADKARQLPRVPLARFGEEADVARTVAFLVSDASAYLTGTVITVDGGRHLA